MIIGIIILILYFTIELTSPTHLINGDTLYAFISIVYWSITVWYLNKYKRGHLFCFELLFSISFFLASFLGPILLPLLDSWHARIFIKGDDIQTKVFYVCIIGYLCYMLGLIGFKNRHSNTCNSSINIKSHLLQLPSFSSDRIQVSNIITLIFIIIFYLKGGSALLTMYSSQVDDLNMRLGTWGEFLQYSMYAYIVSILVNFCGRKINKKSLWKFIKSLPVLFYLNTLLLVVPLIISGYRSNAVQLIIPIILMYSLVIKVIKSRTIIIMLVLGYFVLFTIGMIRSGNAVTSGDVDTVRMFQDFTSANAASTYFIDYADKHGISGGTNMILKLSSIVPFLQSFLVELFGADNFSIDSSTVFTQTFMDTSDGGLGTSLIGDLYYSVGLVGTMLLMYILGLIIRKTNKADNQYLVLMMLILTGNAIFAARVEYFYIVRVVSFSLIILYVVLHFGKHSQHQMMRMKGENS